MAKGGKVEVDITGNASKLGEAAGQAQRYINELKKQGLDALTAGVYTGGAMALAEKTIEAIRTVVTEIKEIIRRAEALNVTKTAAINLKAVGDIVGVGAAGIDAGVQVARRQRADALAGDDQAIKAFESLGIALAEIRNLEPDRLFNRILMATRDMTLTAQSYANVARLIGPQAADALLPYTRTTEGYQALMSASGMLGTLRNPGLSAPGLSAGVAGTEFAAGMLGKGNIGDWIAPLLKAVRQPFEPFSAFGIQTREQAEFAAEQNRQRLNTVARSQLTTEERINEVIAERLRIMRLIEGEADPVKRQKFISDAIAVEAELAALAMRKEGGGATRFTGTRDPMREIGAGFSMFASAQATNLAQQQVVETQNVRRSIETGLARLADILADPGGGP